MIGFVNIYISELFTFIIISSLAAPSYPTTLTKLSLETNETMLLLPRDTSALVKLVMLEQRRMVSINIIMITDRSVLIGR